MCAVYRVETRVALIPSLRRQGRCLGMRGVHIRGCRRYRCTGCKQTYLKCEVQVVRLAFRAVCGTPAAMMLSRRVQQGGMEWWRISPVGSGPRGSSRRKTGTQNCEAKLTTD